MALTSVTIANIWFGMPFSMILIAAALTNIPEELYEAAALDGAGPIARFRFITLPAISPALLAVACLVTISSLRAFDVIFAMTHGGPLDSTNVLPEVMTSPSAEFPSSKSFVPGPVKKLVPATLPKKTAVDAVETWKLLPEFIVTLL